MLYCLLAFYLYIRSMFYVRIFIAHPLVRSVFTEMLIFYFPLLASIVPPPGVDAACPGPPVGGAAGAAPPDWQNVHIACARGPKRVGPTGNRGPP